MVDNTELDDTELDDTEFDETDAEELFTTGAFRMRPVVPAPTWSSSPWMLVVMIAVVCAVVTAWLFVVLPVLADLFFYANPWLMAPPTPF
jgi:hypothetical protein